MKKNILWNLCTPPHLNDSRLVRFLKRILYENYFFRKFKQDIKIEIKLSEKTQTIVDKIQQSAEIIYGDGWNYYSNALKREMVEGFEICVQHLQKSHPSVNYLEIGSCQGISMAIIGSLLKSVNVLNRLVSIDPYFQEGYYEGLGSVYNKEWKVNVNKTTKINALELYQMLYMKVELIEKISLIALKDLMFTNQKFDLIYIDGLHEGINPLRDLVFCLELISEDGIIILDDHDWIDVKDCKELCDRHYEKIYENWKIAAYRICKK